VLLVSKEIQDLLEDNGNQDLLEIKLILDLETMMVFNK
jgi:hypothetical protein